MDAGAANPRHLRQGLADLLNPLAGDNHRRQIRVVEVAVVLRGLLRAALRGRAIRFLVVAGFLDDLATVDKHLRLALHLKTHRLLDRAQGVDVLGFGTRAELFLAHRAQ